MNSKKKGNKTERQVAHLFKEWSGWEFSRVPQSGGLRWKKADNISGDIVCSEPNKNCWFSIEVKGYKDINFAHLLYDVDSDIEKFWEQAKSDAKRAQKVPMLWMRYNGLPKDFFFVVMDKRFARFAMVTLTHYPKYMLTRELCILPSTHVIHHEFKDLNMQAKKWYKNGEKTK